MRIPVPGLDNHRNVCASHYMLVSLTLVQVMIFMLCAMVVMLSGCDTAPVPELCDDVTIPGGRGEIQFSNNQIQITVFCDDILTARFDVPSAQCPGISLRGRIETLVVSVCLTSQYTRVT